MVSLRSNKKNKKNKELNPLLTKEPEDEIKDEATKKLDPNDEESHMKAGEPGKKNIKKHKRTIDFMSIQCQLDRSSKIIKNQRLHFDPCLGDPIIDIDVSNGIESFD